MIRIPDDLIIPEEGTPPDAAPDVAAELAIARGAAALTSAEAEASRALHDLERSFERHKDDPARWIDIFDHETRSLRDAQASRLSDPQAQAAFARGFDDLVAAKRATLRRKATALELDDARAQLDSALANFAAMSAEAASDIEREIVESQAEDTIDRMSAAGFLREGDEETLRQDFLAQRDRAQIDRLIADDPAAAEAALADPERFTSVPVETRTWLSDRAILRQEEEQRNADAAARSAHDGRVAGLVLRLHDGKADRADIMQAAAEGWLGAAERDRALWLLADWRRADEKRQGDIDRVNDSLRGDGPTLDPGNPDDEAAIESHFEVTRAAWLAAGIQEDQLVPLIVDYVRRTGILPSSVRREIAGAFRSGDLQAALRAQELMARLPPSALASINQRDGAEALLGLALQRTGWSPEQAADRATRIMAGTVEPDDRFFDHDFGVLSETLQGESGGERQLASLPQNDANVISDAAVDVHPQDGAQAKVAITDVGDLIFLYGLAALAALMATKTAREMTERRDRGGGGSDTGTSSGPLPPPGPLQSQEQMPPQPSELPNIPPSPPSSDTEELVPPIFVIREATIPPPDPNDLPIQIYDPPDLPIPDIIERKGNQRTRAYLEVIRDYVLTHNPHLKHIAGGRDKDGREIAEYWHPGPGYAEDEFGKRGDGRPGGHWADLTLQGAGNKIVHIQLVDVDKNGNPTDREWKNALALAQPHFVNGELIEPDVILIPKPWQMRR